MDLKTHAAQSAAATRAVKRKRRVVIAIGLMCWLTGVAWLIYHYFMPRMGEFGPEPHPLEAWWLKLHGLAAFAAMILLGWLWAVHMRPALRAGRWRRSGIVLVTLSGLLVVSGYLLYYGPAQWHDMTSLAHWLIGVGLPVVALAHILIAGTVARRARPVR